MIGSYVYKYYVGAVYFVFVVFDCLALEVVYRVGCVVQVLVYCRCIFSFLGVLMLLFISYLLFCLYW